MSHPTAQKAPGEQRMHGSDSPARRRRIGAVALALVLLAVPLASRAASLFQLDQRYGSIAFTVSNLGLFRSHGGFARFVGRLTLDAADPTATKISVTVAADSLHTPWAQETEMLRSADFFDVARHKEIRFDSDSVRSTGPGSYAIMGRLTLRGITRPIILTAKLMHATIDKATGHQIDDFVVYRQPQPQGIRHDRRTAVHRRPGGHRHPRPHHPGALVSPPAHGS